MAEPQPVRIEHSAVFDGNVAAAWNALTAVDGAIAQLADVTVEPVADGGADGRIKLRFGTVNPTFRGTARVLERNGRAHRVVLEIRGADVRGSGGLAATVTAAVRRAGDATLVRVHVEVEFTGRPADLSEARQRAAVTRIVEPFLQGLTDSSSRGDAVADQPAENASSDADDTQHPSESTAPRKRPRPSPTGAPVEAAAGQPPAQSPGEPAATGSTPDLPPDDSVERPVTEPALDPASEPVTEEPRDADPEATAPAFGTPGGIPVPVLADEPSVNGHLPAPATPLHPDEKSPLATSTRQAMARRVAPVALGMVFVLAAARRRRGRSA